MKNNKMIELPVEIGTTLYDKECGMIPVMVTGYSIGRIANMEEEDFEYYDEEDDEYYSQFDEDELYVYYKGCGISGVSPVSDIGVSLLMNK